MIRNPLRMLCPLLVCALLATGCSGASSSSAGDGRRFPLGGGSMLLAMSMPLSGGAALADASTEAALGAAQQPTPSAQPADSTLPTDAGQGADATAGTVPPSWSRTTATRTEYGFLLSENVIDCGTDGRFRVLTMSPETAVSVDSQGAPAASAGQVTQAPQTSPAGQTTQTSQTNSAGQATLSSQTSPAGQAAPVNPTPAALQTEVSAANGVVTLKIRMPGNAGRIRWFDALGILHESPLGEGALPAEAFFFIGTQEASFAIGQPRIYRDLGLGTLEDAAAASASPASTSSAALTAVAAQAFDATSAATAFDVPSAASADASAAAQIAAPTLRLVRGNGEWTITATFAPPAGTLGVFWCMDLPVGSPDLASADALKAWSTLDLDRKARITDAGYLYASPSTYYPYSTRSYWRIPSSYVVPKLLDGPTDAPSRTLAQALLALAADNVNAQGWFPTQPVSSWLMQDYGIGAGFFDTRFNADAIENYLTGGIRFGSTAFRNIARKLADWYVAYGERNHYAVAADGTPKASAAGAAAGTATGWDSAPALDSVDVDGWLVQDYGQIPTAAATATVDPIAQSTARPTHCSLNHQLQAIHVFLLLYEKEGRPEDLAFASRMLEGIRATETRWVKPDGNLEYAWMTDGTMGLTDYPYLTYNDLCDVQDDLARITGSRDACLDRLMASKKAWMDRNGVKGYRGATP